MSASIPSGSTVVSAVKSGNTVSSTTVAEIPQAVIYFNINPGDTSSTVISAGTTIRIRIVAERDSVYDYTATVVPGQTVGDAVAAVADNMRTAGWDVTILPSGRSIIVNGHRRFTTPNVIDRVVSAGITYDDAGDPNAEQPVGPGLVGGVAQQVWIDGDWVVYQADQT